MIYDVSYTNINFFLIKFNSTSVQGCAKTRVFHQKPNPVGLTGLNRVLMGFNGENWVIKYWSFGQILEGSY